jgi:hypothetical protein
LESWYSRRDGTEEEQSSGGGGEGEWRVEGGEDKAGRWWWKREMEG